MATRSKILSKISKKHPTLKQGEIFDIFDLLISSIIDYLARGGRVELRGLGSFSMRSYTLKTQNLRLSRDRYLRAYFRPSINLLRSLNKGKKIGGAIRDARSDT